MLFPYLEGEALPIMRLSGITVRQKLTKRSTPKLEIVHGIPLKP
jgi:hypothetical protein